MVDRLVNRLRGQYGIGPGKEFGTRSFADFVPPISLEAANRIEELEAMLRKKMDLIKCGIAVNYSGSPYENELYTEASKLLEEITQL
jgi:hypothetical protein